VSAEAWEGFRRAVLASPALQRELLSVEEPNAFCALVVGLARGAGWDVELDDVQGAMHAARRSWVERWI
jgi:hypothetical protein